MKFAVGMATLLALSGCAATASQNTEGETKLASLIEGRIAGEPVRCISGVRSNQVRVIDGVGIVYDAGETIYVARATNPRELGRTDALVLDRLSTGRLCTDDVRFTIDRNQGNVTGPVFLSDFVPYHRP